MKEIRKEKKMYEEGLRNKEEKERSEGEMKE